MAVDHCAFIDIGACIDEHWWHADDAGRDISAVANARAPGNYAHAVSGGKRSDRIGVLVEKLKRRTRGRHFNNSAHAKPKQDSAFHPRVRPPLAVCIAFSRANLSTIKGGFELVKDREVAIRVIAAFARRQSFYSFT